MFDTTVFRDVLDTRYGHVALVRLALLVLAIPLLRVLLHRRPAAEHPLRWWWKLSALVVGAGHRGHARASPATPAPASRPGSRSRPTSCTWRAWRAGSAGSWCCASRCCRDATSTSCARCCPRYSALALGAIVALVVSGAYQAWRQVGSIDELKSTDYGRLLIAKLVAFAALIVAAAFSREVVNRRFRDLPPDDDDELVTADDPVLVGAGGRVAVGRGVGGRRRRSRRRRRVRRRRRRPTTTGTTTPRTRRR